MRGFLKGPKLLIEGLISMPLTREEKTGVVGKFQRSAHDTGSPEVQIALLSERINGLSQHFTTHKSRPCIASRTAQDGQSAPPSCSTI